jgi:hypothetical protein
MTVSENDGGHAVGLITEAVSVHVRSGRTDMIVEVDIGHPIGRVLEKIAAEHGQLFEELIIIRDGMEEPLDHRELVDHDYPHQHRHHVHQRHPVDVTVHYQSESRHHEFRRHDTLEPVLDWSIRVFNIDPTMAAEFELTLVGSADELPLSEHVGHLAGKDDKLELNLVRGGITNGAGHD